MKIYILIFLIFLSACNNDLKNPNISFETIPEKAQIGFPINHKVVINDLGELFTLDSVAWEDSSAWLSDSSKVFIKESNIDTLKNSILLNYQITFWDTGSVAIPPLYAFVSFPDSSEASILKTDSSFVYISSVLDTTMTTVIADKPLKEIQFPIERLRLFAFLILSLLILYTFYLIRTRDKEKISKRKFFNFNPKSKALKDVEKIDLNSDATEFFVKISEVLRKYFQNNFSRLNIFKLGSYKCWPFARFYMLEFYNFHSRIFKIDYCSISYIPTCKTWQRASICKNQA